MSSSVFSPLTSCIMKSKKTITMNFDVNGNIIYTNENTKKETRGINPNKI